MNCFFSCHSNLPNSLKLDHREGTKMHIKERERGIYFFHFTFCAILLAFLFVMMTPLPGRAAFLDRSGSSGPYLVVNDVSLAGHVFKLNSAVRTYHMNIGYYYYDNNTASTHNITNISCTMVWNGANNRLTVSSSKYGHATFQCDHHDPILNGGAANGKLIESKFKHTSNSGVALDQYLRDNFMHDLKSKMVSLNRLPLIWEAMAKSMTTVKPKPGKKVPANVLLQVNVASDIPVPSKQVIDFYVTRQDRKPLLDASGKKIKMPITAKFITNNTAFHSLNNLPKGIYLFHAQMMTSLTTGLNSKKVSFTVGKKRIAHFKRGIFISSPTEKKYYTGDIPVTINLPQLMPGSSLRLILGFKEDTVPNNQPFQAQYFPFPIMNEKFDLKDGQTTFTKKYNRNQLITVTKNKLGQFQLRAELSIPGADLKSTSRIFHLAHLGEAAHNEQQLKSGKINLNLPAKHGLASPNVSTKTHKMKPTSLPHADVIGGKQTVGSKLKPAEIKSNFKIISPKSGDVYRKQFLVDINVPPALPGHPTITLELICRPLKKGLLKKRTYSPSTTLMTMPLYARYKDQVRTPVMAYNIQSKVFHGKNRFSVSEFKIKAIIHAGKTTLTQTSGWFKIQYDDRTYGQANSTVGKSAPGVRLVGTIKTFKAPAYVKISVGHVWNSEIDYQIQSNNCKFGKKYQTISLKPKITIKDETVKILTFFITNTGCYRVRARHRKTGTVAVWSPWCKFTVTGNNLSGAKLTPSLTPHHIQPKAINPQPKLPGQPTPQPRMNKVSPKTINPQPEPPGRPALMPTKKVTITIQTPRERQKFMMTGKSVHITTKISSSTKVRLQIQLQKKQKNRFIDIHPRISQHFNHAQTIADFTLNQKGEYRFRVKTTAKNSNFGHWRTFLIDATVKHSVMPKPAPVKPTAPKTSKPVTTLHPTLQHIR